ncbi:DUF4145 domain-containing protein [Paraburkholderia caledonica]|uniref:DUF4145 domain-containing protein n=1 Tax=Paraburkholderia caledonica TaxID=134536 RepID=UPI000B49659C|nr:hypothetical protein BWU74_18190 [Burkholderia sp. Bk]
MSFAWTCPYCNKIATILDPNLNRSRHVFDNQNKLGQLVLSTTVTVCPNDECREFTISANLNRAKYQPNLILLGAPIQTWKLKPQSEAKPFPDYIPSAIRQDYEEACLIADLSPKASATLSRRCLQGIIRDYWKITKSRLVDEIAALKDKIDPTTWQAIDSVRNIGNIGAHMEKDINLIIDVEPAEASLLLRLIEVLLKEWYIGRHEREEHMHQIIAAAQSKADIKKGEKSQDTSTAE